MHKALITFEAIEKQAKKFVVPSVTRISRKHSPYQVLISCILSLRTKDKVTNEASNRLFKAAGNADEMAKLSRRFIEKLIYPVGFYHNKARVILDISRRLIREFSGKVPSEMEALLGFKGVGRKTANLVLGLGYKIPSICVDTHVHRISNRLGWVNTKVPAHTEEELKKIFPRRKWIALNTVLVSFGQNICLPVSPFCSICAVDRYCLKRALNRHR
ncbi:MAG: endonuclease III [Candidatus Omnitrophota bacterium]